MKQKKKRKTTKVFIQCSTNKYSVHVPDLEVIFRIRKISIYRTIIVFIIPLGEIKCMKFYFVEGAPLNK